MINGRAFAVAGLTERVARSRNMNIVIGTAERPIRTPAACRIPL